MRYWITLGLLIRRHAKFSSTVTAVGQERESILRLQKYMLANLAQNIGLQKLADYFGWSRYFLIRAFHKQVGVTPYAWLLNQRVIYARSLLRSSVNLADVANRCGFFDQSHFSLVFKRMVGVSPGRYQKGCNIFQ